MLNLKDQIDGLQKKLQQPLPGLKAQELMAGRVLPLPLEVPENARPSAVLCLLYPLNNVLHLLLMKRMPDKGAHSGQVSFPGGKKELSDENLAATALREANEETGILPAEIKILGSLTPLYIPVSNFQVFPFVGFTPARPLFNINPDEVDHLLELPLDELWHAERKTVADVTSPALAQVIRQVKAYRLDDGTIIWGATAMILSELEVILADDQNQQLV